MMIFLEDGEVGPVETDLGRRKGRRDDGFRRHGRRRRRIRT